MRNDLVIPKGYRLLEYGEALQPGDFAWTLLNGDAEKAPPLAGWLALHKVHDGSKIDDNHVPVIREIK